MTGSNEGQGRRLLVVDDEPHIRHVVALKFRNAGFEVVTAGDGEEALEMAAANPPDLIIADYQMPYLDGLQMCRKMAQHERLRNVPAIMLTARGLALNKSDTDGTIIRKVLSKPFGPHQLLDEALQVLETSDGSAPAKAA